MKSKAKSVIRDLWHNDCPFKEKIVPLKEKNTFTLTSPNTFLMSRSPTLIPMWKRTSSSICIKWSLLTNCEADDESVPLNKSKTFWIWWICGRYTNEHFIIPDVKIMLVYNYFVSSSSWRKCCWSTKCTVVDSLILLICINLFVNFFFYVDKILWFKCLC